MYHRLNHHLQVNSVLAAKHYGFRKGLSTEKAPYILVDRVLTIVLPVILYGCETWSLTLRAERKVRVFENRVLRRIFGPRRDEATGEWRKLHNEQLNDLYSSPNIVWVITSRRMRWVGHVARMGERSTQGIGGET